MVMGIEIKILVSVGGLSIYCYFEGSLRLSVNTCIKEGYFVIFLMLDSEINVFINVVYVVCEFLNPLFMLNSKGVVERYYLL